MMRSVLIVGGTVVVGLGLIGLWAFMSRPSAEETAPMTYVEAPSEVANYVALGPTGLGAAENFVGHRIWVIAGTVQNASRQAIRSIEMRLAFRGYDQTTVHEFEGEALRSSLAPDESRPFEFRFENLPDEWNRDVPLITVERVGY